MFHGDNNATVCYLPGTTGWGSTFGGRPTALWDPQVPYAYTTDSGTITNPEYIDPGLAVQAGPLCEPAPPRTVQSTAASQLGRITPVASAESEHPKGQDSPRPVRPPVGNQSAYNRILARNSPVMMALAGGLGVSALLALSVAHNQNTSRAKRRKLAGPKIGLQIPRQISTPAKVRNAIKDKFVYLPVSHQRKSRLRMERDKCCRLCGEPAVRGAFCLKHGIAHRERARKKLGCKRRNNNNTLSYKLDAKAKATARRKRTKKSK
jgi:hypothetical protein